MDTDAEHPRLAQLECLRGEARFMAAAGMVMLAAALPLTLIFVATALGEGGGSPLLPLAVGAPPIMIGYLSCHYASRHLAKVKALDHARAIGSPEPNLLANS